MKISLSLPPRRMPLAILSCVAFALASCEPKSAATDPARERQLQDMQAKLDALSTQSAELNKQLADRDAQDAEAKRSQLESEQAEIEKQREQLEKDRQALADATPVAQYETDSSENSARDNDDENEPVYQGQPASYDVFYSKLQDDGDWIESDDYGYIWQPTVAARDTRWRPYSDGRWVETDRGWTWDSNERFGWATYHYGRWVNLSSSGWCWVPGDKWAPAWVSWRSNDRYVGWAPLPPEARISRGGNINASRDVGYNTGPGFYNFVDTEDFGEETYLGHIVAPEQNVTIINETVNVTNITYNDTEIHNYGPDYDAIRRRSRRPVDRYQLDLNRSAQFDRDATVPRPRGDRLAVVAPVFAENRGDSNVRPVKIEKKIQKADRADGWRGVDATQRQVVKANLEKQADRQVQAQQVEREKQRQIAARQAARANRPAAAAQAQPAVTTPQQQTPVAPQPERQQPPGNVAKPGRPEADRPANNAQQEAKQAQNAQQERQAQRAQQEKQAQRATAQRQAERAANPASKRPDSTTPTQPAQPDAAELEAKRQQRQSAQAQAQRQANQQNAQAAQAKDAAELEAKRQQRQAAQAQAQRQTNQQNAEAAQARQAAQAQKAAEANQAAAKAARQEQIQQQNQAAAAQARRQKAAQEERQAQQPVLPAQQNQAAQQPPQPERANRPAAQPQQAPREQRPAPEVREARPKEQANPKQRPKTAPTEGETNQDGTPRS